MRVQREMLMKKKCVPSPLRLIEFGSQVDFSWDILDNRVSNVYLDFSE